MLYVIKAVINDQSLINCLKLTPVVVKKYYLVAKISKVITIALLNNNIIITDDTQKAAEEALCYCSARNQILCL